MIIRGKSMVRGDSIRQLGNLHPRDHRLDAVTRFLPQAQIVCRV